MTYEMHTSVAGMRPADLYENGFPPPFKPAGSSFGGRALSLAEQAELEFELRYRGNMIVDQQRKIQNLEEELKRTRDQMDLMSSQLTSYEQERLREKKKPQSRYWTAEEHQRFLEALAKYGHKDVKAISMHVSTRNATQVRTHAQKYFLRLEREKRKKTEGNDKDDHDGYGSSGSSDEGIITPEPDSPADDALSQFRRSIAKRQHDPLIPSAQARFASDHAETMLALLPRNWTSDDYDQFVKGLLACSDKREMDMIQICRFVRENYLSHHSPEEVEACYRQLQQCLAKQSKTAAASPKRKRTNTGDSSSPVMASSPVMTQLTSYQPAMNSALSAPSIYGSSPHYMTPSNFTAPTMMATGSASILQPSLMRGSSMSSSSGPAPMMQVYEVSRRSGPQSNMMMGSNMGDYMELPVLGHEMSSSHFHQNLPAGYSFAFDPSHSSLHGGGHSQQGAHHSSGVISSHH